MNYRSFCLHFEFGVLMYNNSSIKDIEKDFRETLKECKEIKLKDIKNGFFRSLKRSILRLLSQLM